MKQYWKKFLYDILLKGEEWKMKNEELLELIDKLKTMENKEQIEAII